MGALKRFFYLSSLNKTRLRMVIKKALHTMNAASRIRSAYCELKYHFIVSKTFVENIGLKQWQTKSLGVVELKGKGAGIELFSLKI